MQQNHNTLPPPRRLAGLRRAGAPLLCLAAAAACAPVGLQPTPSPAAAVARHVVVISIDGLRPDAIERAGARTLQRLMAEGAYTLEARTILPSKTLPSHTSMLTGVPPEVHGITWNEEQVDEHGLVGVPTVFDLAHEAGLTTAAFFGKAKFRHLIHPGSLDRVVAPRGGDVVTSARMVAEVRQFLRYHRPNLLFVHLPDPDLNGHAFGWMSLPYRAAVRRADGAVGRIVEAATRAFGGDVVVIVTADHGGSGHGHGTESEEHTAIPWIAWGRGVTPGKVEGAVRTMDTAATALWVLGVPVPPAWAGHVVAGAFRLGTEPALAR
ncbi:MAG TPA: ectonucleotide pyrophosphatase/phosphodiesterase [Longimicrobiaceae bacterium]|nr:ectonucleotide pyrophosphatase/phosphodiesterase [Longimicrobiaceae bacterium]